LNTPTSKKKRKHGGQLFDSPRNAHVQAMGKNQGCAMGSKNWSRQLHGARNVTMPIQEGLVHEFIHNVIVYNKEMI
jgi:hypothetical protein